MKIRVAVDAERSRLGRLYMDTTDGKRYGPVDVCATADASAARAAGNASGDPLRPGGHAPLGTYVLKEVRRVADAMIREWGRITLVFEPRSGEARQAESFGRLVLVMHGGQPGDDGRLRTTSIGLRVDPDTLDRVAVAADRGERVDLDVHEVPIGIWYQIFFCRRRPSRGFDSESKDTSSRTDRDDWSSTGSTSSTRDDAFAGKGGQSGGAGASGSWDAARTGGVAAAGAAALGAGVVSASELGLGGGGEEVPGESSSSAGDATNDTDASSSSSESGGSESSTSY